MFATGLRGPMVDTSGKPRPKGTTLSLEKVVQSFGFTTPCTLHNAGNDAFMTLWALQMLLDGPDKVKPPIPLTPVGKLTPLLPPRPPNIRTSSTQSLDRARKEVRPKSTAITLNINTRTREPWGKDISELGVLQANRSLSAGPGMVNNFESLKLR